MADLTKVGTFNYVRHQTTETLFIGYCVDDGPDKLWKRGDPVPPEFIAAATEPDWTVVIHNVGFDGPLLRYNLHLRSGFPIIPADRFQCTLTACLSLGLPAKLDTVAGVLGLRHRKDAAGARLMLKMCKPRKQGKGEDPNGIYWHEDPADMQRLGEYCRGDIRCGRELAGRVLPLAKSEQAYWLMSERINASGFTVDRAFAEAALKITAAAMPELDAEMAELTGGRVTAISQLPALKQWLSLKGYNLPKLDRETIEALLADDDAKDADDANTAPLLPEAVRRALELRRDGAPASVKKINALLARVGEDGRIRGAYRFHGTRTGRWIANGLQPQNLRRPKTKAKEIPTLIEAVATGDYALVKARYPKVLSAVGDCIRSMIVAPPGYRLIAVDLSSIESRTLAWIANELWKLANYREYDRTGDPRLHPY